MRRSATLCATPSACSTWLSAVRYDWATGSMVVDWLGSGWSQVSVQEQIACAWALGVWKAPLPPYWPSPSSARHSSLISLAWFLIILGNGCQKSMGFQLVSRVFREAPGGPRRNGLLTKGEMGS